MKNHITVIGAGAAGLFCAAQLTQRGYYVTLIDNGKQPGRKILISGGGRCNFTNRDVNAQHYISHNPHFCKSALQRYQPEHFISLIKQHAIKYEERENGQLFCTHSAKDILKMLLTECQKGSGKTTFMMQWQVEKIEHRQGHFILYNTQQQKLITQRVIVASGGLSLPKLGTTPIGYKIAEQFSLPIIPVRAGLVPFTLDKQLLAQLSPLAGIAIYTKISVNKIHFSGNMLFTHRGLSGPAILQISNYWQTGQTITIDCYPSGNLNDYLVTKRQFSPKQQIKTVLNKILPKRLVDYFFCYHFSLISSELPLSKLSKIQIKALTETLHHWQIQPNGTEGYRTAEITLGGIDTRALSSKTMQVQSIPNLHFIGEVLDVSGWLGGYNLQWAWSSAWTCAQGIIEADQKTTQ